MGIDMKKHIQKVKPIKQSAGPGNGGGTGHNCKPADL